MIFQKLRNNKRSAQNVGKKHIPLRFLEDTSTPNFNHEDVLPFSVSKFRPTEKKKRLAFKDALAPIPCKITCKKMASPVKSQIASITTLNMSEGISWISHLVSVWCRLNPFRCDIFFPTEAYYLHLLFSIPQSRFGAKERKVRNRRKADLNISSTVCAHGQKKILNLGGWSTQLS